MKSQISNLKTQNQNLKPKTNKNENQIEELLKVAERNNLDAVAPVLINPDERVVRTEPFEKRFCSFNDVNVRIISY
jgi:hypothetical protein